MPPGDALKIWAQKQHTQTQRRQDCLLFLLQYLFILNTIIVFPISLNIEIDFVA